MSNVWERGQRRDRAVGFDLSNERVQQIFIRDCVLYLREAGRVPRYVPSWPCDPLPSSPGYLIPERYRQVLTILKYLKEAGPDGWCLHWGGPRARRKVKNKLIAPQIMWDRDFEYSIVCHVDSPIHVPPGIDLVIRATPYDWQQWEVRYMGLDYSACD